MKLLIAGCWLILMTSVAGATSLTVTIGGDFYDGGPEYELLVNGDVVKKGIMQDEIENLAVEVNAPIWSIVLRFINDKAILAGADGSKPEDSDRNLYIRHVSIDGEVVPTTAFTAERGRMDGNSLLLFGNTDAAYYRQSDTGSSVDGEIEPCDEAFAITSFGDGGATLTEDAMETLLPILSRSACDIVITGFSSVSGPASANLTLSRDRAEFVRAFLVSNGVNPDSIEVRGEGETSQFGDSEDANRRVVVETRPLSLKPPSSDD